MLKNNSRNNGFNGGIDIFQNNNIRKKIIKCFKDNNVKWLELNTDTLPITKKYTNLNEKEVLRDYQNTHKSITYNNFVIKIPTKEELIEELKPNEIKKSEKFTKLCKIVESYLNKKKPIDCSYLITENLFDNDKIKNINPTHYSENIDQKSLGQK